MPHTVITTERHEVVRRDGDGFLEVYRSALGELPVVHLAGGPEAMGRQYGALVGGRIVAVARLLANLFAEDGIPESLVHVLLDACWERMAPHVPERFVVEMDAIAEGAAGAGFGLSAADVRRILVATNLDIYRREEVLPEMLGIDPEELAGATGVPPLSCTMLGVWGSRTRDGKMYAMRNLDWISQSGMHEARLLAVYRPEDGHAFASMGYAGVCGVLAGMNAAGIAIAEVGAFSVSQGLDGTPWTFIARRALEEAANLDEAVGVFTNSKHTNGYNHLIAAGDPARVGTPEFAPRAVALETCFTTCEVFHDDDPKEHAAVWTDGRGNPHAYGTPMKEAVFRGDTAFGPATRALQAADDGPGEPENTGNPCGRNGGGTTYTDCHLPMYHMLRAYETGREYVFPVRGTKVIEAGPPRRLGPEELINIAATVAHNTEKLDENDWNVMSVVYAPTDLAFWVAYESRDEAGQWKNAPDSGYWRFDLEALLAQEAT